jgi:carbon storage regulator
MLVLTRKPGEKVHIGDDVVLTVLEVRGNRVRVGIDAPGDVPIARAELNEFWLSEADPALFVSGR